MRLHDLAKMRHHDGQRIDDRIAIELCLITLIGANPFARNAEGRFDGVDAFDFSLRMLRCQSEVIIREDLALCDGFSLDLDLIVIGTEVR